MESLRGKLLIAPPALVDPNFARSVVLIAAHDDEGALGLVLNRPLEVPLAEISPVLESLAALMIFGTVGFPSAECDLAELASGARRARVFAGHSGWGPGQLDGELEDEGWIIGQLAPDELWQPDSTQLWSTALRRKGGSYALLARMPEDVSVN